MDQRPAAASTGLPALKPDGAQRRTRLREFQAQLVERMQAAQRGGQALANQLGIMVAGARYLLDLREAGEIVGLGNLAPVPLTRPWYLGLANIRGNLTSVVDLQGFLGKEPARLEASCRIVAFASSLNFNGGLLVSQVLGLRHPGEMTVLEGEEIAGAPAWLTRHYRDKDGQMWSELSLAVLIQDPDFLHIAV